ncbi:MAG: hypothetical protein KA998_03595 [Rickettsiaceae bacterium]|nr:hypothetical protein [Rickettsiaceae bacterium]
MKLINSDPLFKDVEDVLKDHPEYAEMTDAYCGTAFYRTIEKLGVIDSNCSIRANIKAIADLLIETGSDIRITPTSLFGDLELPALCILAEFGIVSLLKKAIVATPSVTQEEKLQALHYGAHNLKVVKYFVEEDGIDINSTYEGTNSLKKATQMMLAKLKVDKDLIKYYLDRACYDSIYEAFSETKDLASKINNDDINNLSKMFITDTLYCYIKDFFYEGYNIDTAPQYTYAADTKLLELFQKTDKALILDLLQERGRYTEDVARGFIDRTQEYINHHYLELTGITKTDHLLPISDLQKEILGYLTMGDVIFHAEGHPDHPEI